MCVSCDANFLIYSLAVSNMDLITDCRLHLLSLVNSTVLIDHQTEINFILRTDRSQLIASLNARPA